MAEQYTTAAEREQLLRGARREHDAQAHVPPAFARAEFPCHFCHLGARVITHLEAALGALEGDCTQASDWYNTPRCDAAEPRCAPCKALAEFEKLFEKEAT